MCVLLLIGRDREGKQFGHAKAPREDTFIQNCQKADHHDSPVLHGAERLLIGDVVHENEAHSPTVVGSGDGPVSLLACCVLHTDNKI